MKCRPDGSDRQELVRFGASEAFASMPVADGKNLYIILTDYSSASGPVQKIVTIDLATGAVSTDESVQSTEPRIVGAWGRELILRSGVGRNYYAAYNVDTKELRDLGSSESTAAVGEGVLCYIVEATGAVHTVSVEDGSVLAQSVAEGKYAELPDDVCAEQYSVLCRLLKDAGYRHYEISNFALPGYEAKHKSAYWRHVPYVGVGPGAHSLVYRPSFRTDAGPVPDLSGNQTADPVQIPGSSYSQAEGRSYGSSDSLHTGMECPPPGGEASGTDRETCGLMRRWNIPDVAAYLQAAASGDWDGIREFEYLSREQYVTEEIMLGLRTDRGVPRRLLMSESSRERNTEKLLRTGSLGPVGGVVLKQAGSEKESRLRIPEDHFFVSDDIISDLL